MAKKPNTKPVVPADDAFDTSGGTAPLKKEPTDAELIAKTKADLKAKEDAEKAEKAEAKAKAKAEKDAAAAVKKEERAKAKAERDARIAELAASGKTYTGSMLALADKVKQGVYIKGANGQLHTNDELANALDGIGATDVVRIGLDALKIEDNPYSKLNVGQQSMNLRNRMRGAIKKGTLTIAEIVEYIVRNKIHVVTKADIEAAAKAKADKKAEAAAEKAKKDAAKAATAKPAADPAAANAAV